MQSIIRSMLFFLSGSLFETDTMYTILRSESSMLICFLMAVMAFRERLMITSVAFCRYSALLYRYGKTEAISGNSMMPGCCRPDRMVSCIQFLAL